MTVPTPAPVSIDAIAETLTYLADRSPTTDRTDFYATLTPYRDGAMFVATYAGTTSWERHSCGDEIVLVLDGETTLVLLIDDEELPHHLTTNELLIVPQGVWHRFDTPHGVKVISVTPQPTDHQLERPQPTHA